MSSGNLTQSLTVEVTTRCNLKCVMCPHGLPSGYPGQSDIDPRLLDNVLGSLDSLDYVLPTGVGEPLLAPAFWKIVDALGGRTSPKLRFVTNGILLTEANVDRLMKAPIAYVQVSVDAASEHTHRRIRGNDLNRTLSGIKRLINARSEIGQTFEVGMSFVMMRENVGELVDFVQLAKEIGADVVYFEHLVSVPHPENWDVRRGNWRFNYSENDLRSDPRYADTLMELALDEADRLGVRIGGAAVFLEPGRDHLHRDRPCRKVASGWAFAQVQDEPIVQ
jgi:MoaA/NifB/PqqE/SkfB family radical SAM enzyme